MTRRARTTGIRDRPISNAVDDDRLILRIPWKKTPMKRRREIIVPVSASPHDRRPIRAKTRATLVASIARGRRLSLLERRLLEGALRPGQAVMLAQRLALIGRAEQPAPLQQRDHLRAEDV